MDDVEDDLEWLGVRQWWRKAVEHHERDVLLKEAAKDLHGAAAPHKERYQFKENNLSLYIKR